MNWSPATTLVVFILLSISLIYTVVLLVVSRHRFDKMADQLEVDFKEARKMVQASVSDMEEMVETSGKLLGVMEVFAEFSMSDLESKERIETRVILHQLFYNLPANIRRQLPRMKKFIGPKGKIKKKATGGGGDYFDDD